MTGKNPKSRNPKSQINPKFQITKSQNQARALEHLPTVRLPKRRRVAPPVGIWDFVVWDLFGIWDFGIWDLEISAANCLISSELYTPTHLL